MAEYSVVGGYSYESETKPEPLDIDELTMIGRTHADKFIKFDGSRYTPESLGSWRGSYDLPALTYGITPITGLEFATLLENQVEQIHYGYKGGEYKYQLDDTPYISAYGNCEEHKVVGYYVDGDTVYLKTMYFPY